MLFLLLIPGLPLVLKVLKKKINKNFRGFQIDNARVFQAIRLLNYRLLVGALFLPEIYLYEVFQDVNRIQQAFVIYGLVNCLEFYDIRIELYALLQAGNFAFFSVML